KKGERILIEDITKEKWPPEFPQGDGWLIGIAMTALDVHYQYSPLPAKVGEIFHHSHGRNLPMFDLWEYVRITWMRRGVQLFATVPRRKILSPFHGALPMGKLSRFKGPDFAP